MTLKKLMASGAAKARTSSKSRAELAREITHAVRTIRQRSTAPRLHHQQLDSANYTIERGREQWRRIEAQGNAIELYNGNAQGTSSAPASADPTPERRAKALEVGRTLVGRREVKKLKTTLDLLEDHGHLPPHLRIAFEKFCEAIAIALNVSVADEQRVSSARMVSGYGDAPLNAYGPREISDHVLEARYFWKMLERELPLEIRDIVEQLVGEETGLLQGRPASLQRYGREYGWQQDKQAGAAGAMMAIAACAVLHHALKRGIGQRGKQCQ
jgi:hypothetical protein